MRVVWFVEEDEEEGSETGVLLVGSSVTGISVVVVKRGSCHRDRQTDSNREKGDHESTLSS